MEAVIPASSIKLFSKLLACLHKVGSDLFIDAREDQIQLSTLNASKSAFAIVRLHSLFFEQYALLGSNCNTAMRERAVMCKTLLQPLRAVFRQKNLPKSTPGTAAAGAGGLGSQAVAPPAGEAQDTHCQVSIELGGVVPHVGIRLRGSGGARKSWRLHFADTEPQHALYDKTASASHLQMHAGLLLAALAHVHPKLDEISIAAHPAGITVKHLPLDTPAAADPAAAGAATSGLATEVRLDASHFMAYQVPQESLELSFSGKELKSLLGMAEMLGVSVHVYFDGPGNLEAGDHLVLDMVLATVQDEAPEGSQPSQQQNQQQHQQQPQQQQPQQQQRISPPPPPQVVAPVGRSLVDDSASRGLSPSTFFGDVHGVPLVPALLPEHRHDSMRSVRSHEAAHLFPFGTHGSGAPMNGAVFAGGRDAGDDSMEAPVLGHSASQATTRALPSPLDATPPVHQHGAAGGTGLDLHLRQPAASVNDDADDDEYVPATPPPLKRARRLL